MGNEKIRSVTKIVGESDNLSSQERDRSFFENFAKESEKGGQKYYLKNLGGNS